jgi:hypothetical protein
MALSRRKFLRNAGGAYAATTIPRLLTATSFAQMSEGGEHGGNPIVTGVGLCDPQVRIYDNQAYLYATHDADPNSKGFVMNDWWVWHSEDMVHWEQVSTLKPEQTYWGKPSTECWATDAMRRNGKYYFYFSRGPEEIGVVQGDSPRGPWHDPIGKPLIAKGSVPTQARDPGILQEEDGTSYIVFGVWDFFIAFRSHWQYEASFCTPAEGHEKGDIGVNEISTSHSRYPCDWHTRALRGWNRC